MPPYDDTNSVTISIDSDELNQMRQAEEELAEQNENSGGGRFVCTLESLPRKPQERYELVRSIGFGGMKCVLLVHDKDTGREIAMALRKLIGQALS